MKRRSAVLVVLPVISGCGGEKSDVSGGVDAINREMVNEGARLDCPKEVDGAKGAQFACNLEGTQTGSTTKVTMRIVEENGSLAVDFAGGRAQVQAAIRRVTGG